MLANAINKQLSQAYTIIEPIYTLKQTASVSSN